MSSIGKIIDNGLPEDVEKQMAVIHETISNLERTKIDLDNSIEVKKNDEKVLIDQITISQKQLDDLILEQKRITTSLDEREVRISQKEVALDVYAGALKDKENKITRYIGIFDKMKEVVGK